MGDEDRIDEDRINEVAAYRASFAPVVLEFNKEPRGIPAARLWSVVAAMANLFLVSDNFARSGTGGDPLPGYNHA